MAHLKAIQWWRLACCALALAVGCKAEDDSSSPGLSAGTGGMQAGGTGGEVPAGSGGAAGMAPAGASGIGGEAGMVVAGTGGVGGAAGMVEAGTGGVGGEAGGTGGTGGDNPTTFPDLRGTCVGLDSGFPGDDACIPPPPEGEGFQIHVGPADYANPGQFLVDAQDENSICFSFHTPNNEEVFYNGSVLSARPGTHHIINTMFVATQQISDNTFQTCINPGTSSSSNIVGALPGASKPYMPRFPVAPENVGVGRTVPANAPVQADLHYFNPSDDQLIREFWLNIYYMPKEQVTERARGIRGMGGINWLWQPIQPGTDKVFQYQCPITSPGRILTILGHYHAHGERFSAYLKRASGKQEKVFEMYDYNTPAEFAYDSITTNPPFSATVAGATSGMLEVAAGDVLQWECHVINDSSTSLSYVNEVQTGEMCNIWGSTVGAAIDCVHDDPGSPEQPFTIETE